VFSSLNSDVNEKGNLLRTRGIRYDVFDLQSVHMRVYIFIYCKIVSHNHNTNSRRLHYTQIHTNAVPETVTTNLMFLTLLN